MMSDSALLPLSDARPSSSSSSDHRRSVALTTVDHADHSSSTEGPDSPCASSSGSPVPAMLPVPPYRSSVSYDVDDDFERDIPRFRVTFTGDVSKSGDSLRYRMLVRPLNGAAAIAEEPPLDLERQREDFEFLHHCLTTRHSLSGVIVPPLPARPPSDPQSAAAESSRAARRRLGSSGSIFRRRSSSSGSVVSGAFGGGVGGSSSNGGVRNYVQGDDFDRQCTALGAYMDAMISHPLFGRSQVLADFLEHKEAPPRTRVKKGLFSGMMMRQSLDFGLKMPTSSNSKEPDESFAKEKDWSAQYGPQLREAGERFQNVLGSQMRLARQIANLATALAASVGGHDGANAHYNRLNSRFSGCLALERRAVESAVAVEDATMGNYLSLWSGYLDAQSAMLARRACLLSERDGAAKAFAKAARNSSSSKASSAQRLEELRRGKEEKENELERCSKTGKAEVRRFHQRRLTEMRDALVQYAEGQIGCARGACEELTRGLARLSEFPLPSADGGSTTTTVQTAAAAITGQEDTAQAMKQDSEATTSTYPGGAAAAAAAAGGPSVDLTH